ncbi:hypothetical protein HJ588_01820 [Flexivirga sp. ID2601S]|uniref:Uncharacterized protein n=1 Tax=Flexivirga aerilata TaxID=1656889 RepID=A0A849AAR6_9MICO|nr:hypothetical protein [Flexivirga aerilata]NNG38014.1 hypothetical protein [Flexivirga aerilata]
MSSLSRALCAASAGLLVFFLVRQQAMPYADDLRAAPPSIATLATTTACWAARDLRRQTARAVQREWLTAAVMIGLTVGAVGPALGVAARAALYVAVLCGSVTAMSASIAVAAVRPDRADRSDAPVSRVICALSATISAAALLAVPIGFLVVWVRVNWTGCFLACAEPDRSLAVLLGGIVLVLLADVVALGVAGWRRFPRFLTTVALLPPTALLVATPMVLT